MGRTLGAYDLTVEQAAEILGVTPRYCAELCSRGRLPSRQVRRLRREDVERYARERDAAQRQRRGRR